MMAAAYWVTYGLHTTVTRGQQHVLAHTSTPKKSPRFFITEAIDDHPLPLYGDGIAGSRLVVCG